MSDFLEDLELSVRTHNVLVGEGIVTREQFMALTHSDVMAFKGAGRQTANEIVDVHERLNPPFEAWQRQMEELITEHVASLNTILRNHGSAYHARINSDGLVCVDRRVA